MEHVGMSGFSSYQMHEAEKCDFQVIRSSTSSELVFERSTKGA